MTTNAAGTDAPLVARDRLWAGVTLNLTQHPLDLPPLADLRAAAALIATDVPQARLLHRLDLGRGRWRREDTAPQEVAERAVVPADVPGPQEMGVGAHAGAADRAHRPGAPSVRWVVSARGMTTLLDHAVGDGLTLLALPRLLVETARRGVLPDWLGRPTEHRPYRRALRHQYGGAPARALRTLREARPALRPAPSADRPAGPVEAGLVHAVCPAERWREVKAWRRQHVPGTSVTALQATLVHRALGAVGLPPRGGPTVLVDARRYLPPGAVVSGNFVTGLALPAGPEWEPRALSDALDRALDAGRPLSAMGYALALTQARVLGDRVVPARLRRSRGLLVPDDPRPVVAVTAMASPHVDRMPWAGPPVVASLSTPAPAEGVTAAFVETRGTLQVSLSYLEGVYRRADVEAATEILVGDPVALLDAVVRVDDARAAR